MSIADRRGVRVDTGPRSPVRPLRPRDVSALAAAFLHRSGVPETIACRALKVSRPTYYRHLNRAADRAVRLREDLS